MDKYKKETSKREHSTSKENEIRITAPGKVKDYVLKGKDLLEGDKFLHIEIKAMGQAIQKAVTVGAWGERRSGGVRISVFEGDTRTLLS